MNAVPVPRGEPPGPAVAEAADPAVGEAGGQAVAEAVGPAVGAGGQAGGEAVAEAVGAAGGRAVAEAVGRAVGQAGGEAAGPAVGQAEGEAIGPAVGRAGGRAVGPAAGKAGGQTVGAARGVAGGRAAGEAGGEAVIDCLVTRRTRLQRDRMGHQLHEAGRWLLIEAVASVYGLAVGGRELARDEHRRWILPEHGLTASVAHCGEFSAVALSAGPAVGVDLQDERDRPHAMRWLGALLGRPAGEPASIRDFAECEALIKASHLTKETFDGVRLPAWQPGWRPTGVGPTGVASTSAGPTGVGPTGVGPTGVGPTGVAATGAGPTGFVEYRVRSQVLGGGLQLALAATAPAPVLWWWQPAPDRKAVPTDALTLEPA
jgi:hypothetical protein